MSEQAKQTPMMVRMFGVIGLMLASGYFLEGLTLIPDVLHAFQTRQPRLLVWRFTIASLDLITAAALAISALGLLFVQRWAKKMWLFVVSILVFLHLMITTLSHLGRGVSAFYIVWTWMVVMLAAISWWYFTRRSRPPDSSG